MGPSNSSVSVIIPCHNNAYALDMVLQALSKQSSPPDEIICVDDTSDETQLQKIHQLTDLHHVYCFELPRSSRAGRRSMARNLGSKKARGDILLYLDGDMLVGPQYVEGARVIHSRDRRAMIYGRRLSISLEEQKKGSAHCLQIVAEGPADGPKRPSWHSRIVTLLPSALPILPIWRDQLPYSDHWYHCVGNNLSVRRGHVEKIGYWDENYIGWGEEDVDFVYRLYICRCRPITPLAGPIYSYHLAHEIDYRQNLLSLQRNAEYFARKFPALAKERSPNDVVRQWFVHYLQWL